MANKMGFMPNRWNKPTKIVFNNNYFGANPGIYNLMELNCAVKDGSSFSGNTFVKEAASHNFINLYQLADNATINIDNNNFDCGAMTNPIRISAMDLIDETTNEAHAPKKVVINIRNNTFSATDWDAEWGGLLFFQTYGTRTSDFSGLTINLSDNVNNSNTEQLFYIYLDNSKDDAGHYKNTQFMLNPTDTSKFPTIYVDGHQLTNEELLARVVCWDSETNSVVSLENYFAGPTGYGPDPMVEEEEEP